MNISNNGLWFYLTCVNEREVEKLPAALKLPTELLQDLGLLLTIEPHCSVGSVHVGDLLQGIGCFGVLFDCQSQHGSTGQGRPSVAMGANLQLK